MTRDVCFECGDFPCDYLHPYADMAQIKPHNLKVFNLCLIKRMGLEKWDHFQALETEDGRINLNVPEMKDWIQEIDPALESEKLKEDEESYPFIMSSGRHMDYNANTQLRDPAWNKGKRACTAIMHLEDAEKFGFNDGQMVKVTTEAGEEKIELEVTKSTRPGYIMIPHGFGLVFQGKRYGANANRLAKSTHRDRIAGTPYHRYIPCRLEAV